MGCGKSKEEEVEAEGAFQPKNIFYDQDGNLRLGAVLNDKDEELRQVSLSDAFATKLKDEVSDGVTE